MGARSGVGGQGETRCDSDKAGFGLKHAICATRALLGREVETSFDHLSSAIANGQIEKVPRRDAQPRRDGHQIRITKWLLVHSRAHLHPPRAFGRRFER